MAEKRYFWLKLYDDFFTSKRIKKLRSIAGGDTYTIIYLKMQLKALKTDGYLYFDGVMSDFAEELALDIDESPEDVKVTINYLMSVGLLETNDGEEYKLPFLDNCIGSETAHTQRQRDYVKRKKERELLEKASQNDADVTQMLQVSDAEIDKEIDIDIEKNNNTSSEIFIRLILNDKSEYEVTEDEVKKYQELYPSVDVRQQFRSMKGWCDSNPTKRKTRTGIKRFINSWLNRKQNNENESYEKITDNQRVSQKKGYQNGSNADFLKMLEEESRR